MDVVFVVEVVDVVVAKGCCEAPKSSLTSVGQKTSPSRVTGPLVCSPSPSCLALMTECLVMLGVVDVVIVVIVAEVDVQPKLSVSP